jgi:hypothetical protein
VDDGDGKTQTRREKVGEDGSQVKTTYVIHKIYAIMTYLQASCIAGVGGEDTRDILNEVHSRRLTCQITINRSISSPPLFERGERERERRKSYPHLIISYKDIYFRYPFR